jgi:hypothetical protein
MTRTMGRGAEIMDRLVVATFSRSCSTPIEGGSRGSPYCQAIDRCPLCICRASRCIEWVREPVDRVAISIEWGLDPVVRGAKSIARACEWTGWTVAGVARAVVPPERARWPPDPGAETPRLPKWLAPRTDRERPDRGGAAASENAISADRGPRDRGGYLEAPNRVFGGSGCPHSARSGWVPLDTEPAVHKHLDDGHVAGP